MESEDSLYKIMQNGYNVITSRKNWPNKISVTQRIETLTSMKNYFLKLEEFEKCTVLQNKIDELNIKLKSNT